METVKISKGRRFLKKGDKLKGLFQHWKILLSKIKGSGALG